MNAGSVLFVPYPAFGHVNPMLPVIADLVARGLPVRVLVDHRHVAAVRSAGAHPLTSSVAADIYVPARKLGPDTARYIAGRIRKPLAGQAAARLVTAEVTRNRPAIVVVDPMMHAADRAASRAGVRTALLSTTFAYDRQTPVYWPRSERSPWLTTWVNSLRPTVRAFRRDRLVLVNAVPELQPAAEKLGADVHFVGPLLRQESGGDLSRYGLPSTHPVLLVSMGTVFAREPAYFRAIARAFAGTSWLVIIATGPVDPAAIGPLPDNVVAARHVPQLAMLGHAAVFLTHAGMNSALEALSRGVPMVVVPRAGDQLFLARRLVDLGVAVRAPHLPSIRRAVEHTATDPALRAAATRWHDRLNNPATAAKAADLILARARLDRPPGRR